MNNQNYLGSSLFVINLDFGFKRHLEDDEKALERLKHTALRMGPDAIKRFEKIKRKPKRKISMIEEIELPPLK